MDINGGFTIPDEKLLFSFARSGGPGGQNVNKVASKAILHWNIAANATLPPAVKQRLQTQQATRLSTEGFLVIHSRRYRDQPKKHRRLPPETSTMHGDLAGNAPRKPRRATKPSK